LTNGNSIIFFINTPENPENSQVSFNINDYGVIKWSLEGFPYWENYENNSVLISPIHSDIIITDVTPVITLETLSSTSVSVSFTTLPNEQYIIKCR
jgi:hypothetical protein